MRTATVVRASVATVGALVVRPLVAGAVVAGALLVGTTSAGPAGAASTQSLPSGAASGVQVSPPTPAPGATLAVSGRGCAANSRITVALDRRQAWTGRTDAGGSYQVPVPMPGTSAPGRHRISVIGANCPGHRVAEITVVAAGHGGAASHAGTNVAVVGIGAVGVVLLVGGTTMLLAGRRRRHV